MTESWGTASDLLAKAGVVENHAFYREFTSADQMAVLTIPQRIQAAWETNDADAFAEVFTDNGSLLMRDHQLTSKEDIRSYMSAGFGGPLKGARVTGWPIEVKFLSENAAMVVTEGGIIMPGQSEIAAENFIRATWVVTRQPDGELNLVSHQSSPVKG
ncbi:SgcJ/EcaC family oxidoreductase [Catellatospora sp. KI3]|uniref:SgcJ/EcaC family oxidoreductase n=1 Tax=Catellatospora sp. KI3 TaxID=3041620 RepID=UPI002482F1DE|nr:SgcJ/EcaC family oxidoreductase [Catellatospora sp. KI3]MDI1461460.1 SgcJ/EcaC family oxidoreductase [Catellatospora sp. KI3]